MLLTVRNIPLVKNFIYRAEFKIWGCCHYLVTAYFFWIENIPQDISCDTRDVLVQYINSVINTDIPDESDVELYQLVKDSKLIVIVNIFKKHKLHLVVLSFILFYKPFNS